MTSLRIQYYVLLLALAAVWINSTIRGKTGLFNYLELRDRERILAETIHQLEEEIDKIEKEVNNIKTSKAYARKVLRDRYHYVEQDDEAIVFFPE